MGHDSFSGDRLEGQAKPRGMLFTERDGLILKAIAYYADGVLAKRQLKELIWPDASVRAMEMRLTTLHQHSYVNWPTNVERRTKPVPEPVVWLGWQGALWLAGQQGIVVESPRNTGENQLRLFEKRLRQAGFRWLREPGWSKLGHSIAVVDFLMAVERGARQIPGFVLESVIQESVFRAEKDLVEASFTESGGKEHRVAKEVIPDLFIAIVDTRRQIQGEPARARFLIEYDGATHSNPKWGAEKAAPYALYIQSPAYKKRFGHNSGRWLVITTGKVRMQNLIVQTLQEAGTLARTFWFTTLPLVKSCDNVLTSPIWWRTDWQEPGVLFKFADGT